MAVCGYFPASGSAHSVTDSPDSDRVRDVRAPRSSRALLAHGRHTTGPIVQRYLARLAADNVIGCGRSSTQFELLYGLIVRDSQIRALLGETPLSPRQITTRSHEAVAAFFTLTAEPAAAP